MSSRNQHVPPKNRLLAMLSERDYQRLCPNLEAVRLPYRRLLYSANRPIEYVYFLETGVGSLVHTMHNGAGSEVGTMGNEGIVGLPVVLGDDRAPNSVYMQVGGIGLRMKSSRFAEAMEQSASLRRILFHYAHAFFNQVAQSAACNHHHALGQRCCRWLLMTYDRMQSEHFQLTQEFLAMMLGVRRAGVTIAAGDLRRAGLIRYQRGHVTIIDLAGLRARSCECYGITKREFDRLLGPETREASLRASGVHEELG